MSGRGAPAAGPGRREQTKAANRAAILQAAREVFGEIGYGAATVRDIVRRTDLATGTFYNYFPDKESVLRELVDELAGEARRRVRAARLAAGSVEAFVGDSYRAYFALLAEDPETFTLIRRNAGTIRALFGEPAVGASVVELREDLDAGVASGALPPHDTDLMAAAMVGAGLEVGVRMLEREPLDVDAAAGFVTRVFLGALEAFRRDG